MWNKNGNFLVLSWIFGHFPEIFVKWWINKAKIIDNQGLAIFKHGLPYLRTGLFGHFLVLFGHFLYFFVRSPPSWLLSALTLYMIGKRHRSVQFKMVNSDVWSSDIKLTDQSHFKIELVKVIGNIRNMKLEVVKLGYMNIHSWLFSCFCQNMHVIPRCQSAFSSTIVHLLSTHNLVLP